MIKSMILCFVLVVAILNVVMEALRFVMALVRESKYETNNWRILGLFSSIAYIITIICFGL